jgi:hypothetical protein
MGGVRQADDLGVASPAAVFNAWIPILPRHRRQLKKNAPFS